MKRREFLAATVVASLSPLVGKAEAAGDAPDDKKDISGETKEQGAPDRQSDRRRDILVFMVDQLGAKWLEAASAMGLTPHYERLKAMGTTFGHCITSNPLCMPARATMMTGMTTRQHGVLQNGYVLDPALPNYVRILQANGYRTAGFGKFHFVPHRADPVHTVDEYGFDVFKQTQDPDKGRFIKAAGKSDWQGLYGGLKDESATQTAWISRHALEYLRSAGTDKPLYTFVSYVQPHSPFCPPAEYLQRVDPAKLPEPAEPTWLKDPLAPKCLQMYLDQTKRTKASWMEARRYYFADLAHLDDQLGKVLDVLKQAGRLDNTYIIFTADHGEMLGDQGMLSKAERHYDAVIRVPLTVAGPGLKQGQARAEFAQLEDIFPTVLAMAGDLPRPGYGADSLARALPPELPGLAQSLLPLCRGETVPGWRTCGYAESYNDIFSGHLNQWARTIRTERYRYTVYPRNTGEQLFDLANDPLETNNLAGDADHAEVRQQLRDQLLDKIVEQDYPHTLREHRAMGRP